MTDSDKSPELLRIVRKTIERHGLLDLRRPVLVAVSGGADSVALLAVLCELGYSCVAAHCNFHLRGDESTRDMRFVEQLCERLGVDLTVSHFDVGRRMAQSGESVEMACRSLRYERFDRLIDTFGAQAVAVGHHCEDNVETFMLNLSRSTGIAGLCGIRYRNGIVVRPLLDTTRQCIIDYLGARRLQYVTDSSNMSNDYRRNRLRNIVLPVLEEQFPGAGKSILTTIAHLNDNRLVYDKAIASYAAHCVKGNGVIDLEKLSAEAAAPAPVVLYELVRRAGLTRSQADDIMSSPMRSGLLFKGDGGGYELDRGLLTPVDFSAAESCDEYEVSLHRDILTPVNIAVTVGDIASFRPVSDPRVAYLDASVLDRDRRWTLRRYRRGDRLEPFGMKGSKLVSDIFNDAKLSASQKRAVRLLVCDGVIVWIVGLRASRHFIVTPETKRYIRLELR